MREKVRYCRPLQVQSLEKLLAEIQDTDARYEFIEVWLDYIDEVSAKDIEKIVTSTSRKIIFLTRRLNLEEPVLRLEKRCALIEEAQKYDCIIDCDISQENEITTVTSKSHLLLSYHNYECTPSLEELDRLVQKMDIYKPSTYKFACKVLSNTDTIALCSLAAKLKGQGKACVITGMGAEGMTVRVLSALYYNEFNFAPLTVEQSSASGQIVLDDLEELLGLCK